MGGHKVWAGVGMWYNIFNIHELKWVVVLCLPKKGMSWMWEYKVKSGIMGIIQVFKDRKYKLL
jgi:hypothetical protein